MLVVADFVLQPGRIDSGMLPDSHGCRFNNNVVERDVDGCILVNTGACSYDFVHGHGDSQVKVRSIQFALYQALGYDGAQL